MKIPFAREKRYYHKLTATILLTSIIPVLIISILSYINIKMSMENEIQRSNVNYLKRTVNAVEVVMKHIDDSCRQLILDADLKSFEGFPVSSRYEDIRGSIQDNVLQQLYRYLDYKSRVFSKLSAFRLSNEYIYSVYFLDNTKGIILVDDGMQYEKEDFYDKDWYKFFMDITMSPSFMETRVIKTRHNKDKKVLSIVYKTINNYLGPPNCLVINLDADFLYDNVLKKLDDSMDSDIIVVTNSGKTALGDENNTKQYSDFNVPLSEKYGSNEITLKGKKMIYSYVASDILNWKFISVKDVNYLYKGIIYIRWIIVIVLISLLVLTFTFALISVKRIYAPVSNLLQFIKNNTGMSESTSDNGEFSLITHSVEQMVEDKVLMESKLRESLSALRERYMLSLLNGSFYDSKELILEKMEALKINLNYNNLAVMVIEINKDNKDLQPVHEWLYNKVIIIKKIDEIRKQFLKGIIIETEGEKFVSVLNCSKDHMSVLFEFAEKIKEEIQVIMGINLSIGIGEVCQDMPGLKNSYEEAKEALKYRIVSGDNCIIYIEDVRIKDIKPLVYPKEKEQILCSLIKNGEKDNAQRVLLEIMKDVALKNKKLHYHQVQQVFIQLFTSIISTANELGLDLEHIFSIETYTGMILTEHSEMVVLENFKEMINILTEYISNAFSDKNIKHIGQIIKIIESDYGYNISLNLVAEKLMLNPAYVSRIFKEKTGTTFMEYLTNLRMEKSKHLLLETDLKIKDIGEKVGYINSNYFIKIFKEQTGVTPREYRVFKTT